MTKTLLSSAFKVAFATILVLLCITASAGNYPYAKLYKKLPVAMEKAELPIIPDSQVSITEFEAEGDGTTDCTAAFRKAIAVLSNEGGGHVIVPAGTWLTGPIVLKSRIDLHLEEGATILFTPDKTAYFKKDTEGKPIIDGRAMACISADKASDISITGNGTIDGNGQWWRYAKKDKYTDEEWEEFLKMGGTVSENGKLWFPYNLNGYENLTDSPEKEEAIRNHLLIIKRCQRVLLSGVTICNSPKFHVNPSQCTDVVMDGITVQCPWNAQNGDGIDIGNSQRVLVTGCTVDCGDDGICMKGGSGANGVKAGKCKDILICGNTVKHAHGGFVIGSDYSGGMENIVVRNCVFDGSDTGLRFKSMIGRGGVCKDIWISNIVMANIKDAAVTFSCDYSDVSYKTLASGEGKAPEYVPDFADIHISKVTCIGCGMAIYASGIKGLEQKCVHDITISKSTFKECRKPNEIDNETADITLINVR